MVSINVTHSPSMEANSHSLFWHHVRGGSFEGLDAEHTEKNSQGIKAGTWYTHTHTHTHVDTEQSGIIALNLSHRVPVVFRSDLHCFRLLWKQM